MTRPTLADVARQAGVHQATASRALNPALPGRVTDKTAAKVREAAELLGYVPDPLAQGLRTRRTRIIGMLVPDLVNPVFPTIARGVEDHLRSEGYEAIIASTDNDQAREATLLDLLQGRSCDGFIVATAFREDASVASLVEQGVPLVLLNRLVDGLDVSAAVSDDAGGISAAVRYLVARGHTAIGYLAGPPSLSITATRVDAFAKELRRHRVPKRDGAVLYASAYTIEGGREATARMYDRFTGDITAVVTGNDMMAIGCLAELSARGLSCPEDLSLVGFNDMPLVAYLRPALTTIAMPQYELGVEAARLLLRQLATPAVAPLRTVLDTRLVERSSVALLGPPAAAGP